MDLDRPCNVAGEAEPGKGRCTSWRSHMSVRLAKSLAFGVGGEKVAKLSALSPQRIRTESNDLKEREGRAAEVSSARVRPAWSLRQTPPTTSFSGESTGKMNKAQEEIMNRAIGIMQGRSKLLLDICKDKLQCGKTMNVLEVKELREVLEAIAEGLDQDSLLCQEALDDLDNDEPSDVSWPASSPELHPNACLSRQEHFEKLWGVDYDSDDMPNFDD
ncbi:hypothetical protein GUJ93_ZPchr0012g20036 [Zizania palustris]|uniref:Uncharacterized protein n=1 Tax=Zizania palustris TaxID=103762 RepID=A0A8J6BVS9_ZIZPA|nr:hypothetical protein GUJ93_ZPchr0012g20036 [Zizania palustris]